MNGHELLEFLSELKPKLINEYEKWVERYGEPSPSIPTFLSIAKEETALRKAELQQAVARQGQQETARRDNDFRQEENRRVEDRRLRGGSPQLEQRSREELRRRDTMSTAETRGGERSRDVDEEQYNLQAEQLRREEDERQYEADRVRRRVEEKRNQEQDGILRRQVEAEAAARAARRDIVSRVSPVPPTGAVRPDQDRHARPPESPQARSMPVAAPHPARPPNSNQFTDPRLAPSIMSLESPTRYDYDSATDVEGKTEMPWNRSKLSQQDLTPTRRSRNGSLKYDPPITTTSPAPPDLKVNYPTIMSTHQRNQGYVPSLQSMFSTLSSDEPRPDASLLFNDRPSVNDLYSNILPQPSASVQAASQYRQ
ncbi:hypothetical protein EUX98_g9426, partial [Antrodiella citrinella]